MSQSSHNPYSPPVARRSSAPPTAGALQTASRGARLLAASIDLLPFVFALVLTQMGAQASRAGFLETGRAMVLGAAASAVAVLVCQAMLMARRSQTIGKCWPTPMRVVRLDGGRVPFLRWLLLRVLLPWCIRLLPLGIAMYLAFARIVDIGFGHVVLMWTLVAVVDPVWIFFGNQRRCLHDYIAGTRVVNA